MPKFIYGEEELELPDDVRAPAQLIEGMDIEAYHDLGNIKKYGRDAIISKSQLADMECAAKFKHRYIDGASYEDKDHLNVGNAVHTLALEPDLFHDRFYVLPDGLRRDPRTDAYKSAIAEAAGRKMVTHKDFQNVQGMAKSLVASKIAMQLLDGAGKIESSIIWTDERSQKFCPVHGTGQSENADDCSCVKLRCRPDLMRDDGLLVDLKTGHTADPNRFSRVAFDLHYDVSVAMTCEGYKQLTGKKPDNYVFLVVESEAPYIVEAYDSFRPWDPNDMAKFTYFDAGHHRFRTLLDRYISCRRSDVWLGYNRIITPMSVPVYGMRQIEAMAQSQTEDNE